MSADEKKVALYLDDEIRPQRAALYEEGELVDHFEANQDGQLSLGAIVIARITHIHSAQRRAECQLPDGTFASFRLGAKPYPKAGDLKTITLTAEPRQHKPWQAEQAISRVGRYVVLHYGEEGVRQSFKAKSGKGTVPKELEDAIKDNLVSGWGAVIKRHTLERLNEIDRLLPFIQEEISKLLEPLDKQALHASTHVNQPKILYQGDDIRLAGQLAAHCPPQLYYEANAPFWDEVSDRIEAAYNSQVTLENGVILTVEKTQALTAIDIDSGASRLSPKEIARQTAKPIMKLIRLARLSGIVVVDMPRIPAADGQAVLEALRDEARYDRRSPDILGFSRAGLIEIVIRHHYAPITIL